MSNSFALEIPSDVDHLAAARRQVRRWLDGEGVDTVIAIDLVSVASEFLLHAIVRAGGAGTVRLVGERRADGVRLAVRAPAGTTAAVRPLRLPPDPLAEGAIGRRMVELCCDEVRIGLRGDEASAECFRGVA